MSRTVMMSALCVAGLAVAGAYADGCDPQAKGKQAVCAVEGKASAQACQMKAQAKGKSTEARANAEKMKQAGCEQADEACAKAEKAKKQACCTADQSCAVDAACKVDEKGAPAAEQAQATRKGWKFWKR